MPPDLWLPCAAASVALLPQRTRLTAALATLCAQGRTGVSHPPLRRSLL
jgi:hypothetical protein